MPSITRTRATGLAATVAIAASAFGLPAGSAAATPRHPSAAFRLAEQPFRVDRQLAHGAAKATHVIRAGDTLSGIAKKYGTTVEALRSTNGLDSNRIYAGEQLTIPSAGSASTSRTPRPATSQRNGQPAQHSDAARQAASAETYTVVSGDTLSGIAQAKGVTVAELRAANPKLARSSQIFIGDVINLPGGTAQQNTARKQAGKQQKSQHQVGKTFAGRTYSDDVTRAAQANKDALMSRGVPSRAAMQRMVASTAQAKGVDPRLAQAIAYQESGFNMRSVSPANAVGVMQLIPSSVEWSSQMAGRRLNALDPQDNVLAGVLLLKATLGATDGDVDKTIAAYYQGLRSVSQNGLYADTTAYVASVRSLMGRF